MLHSRGRHGLRTAIFPGKKGASGLQLEWEVPIICAIGVVIATAIMFVARPANPGELFFSFGIPAIGLCVAFVFLPFMGNLGSYYGTQAVIAVCFVAANVGAEGVLGVQIFLLALVLTDFVLLEPYPLNLVESIAIVSIGAIARAAAVEHAQMWPSIIFDYYLPFVLSGLFLAAFGSLMTRHREHIVNLTESRNHIMERLVELAKEAAVYQDYAIDAGASAAESERLRITRDIHDIVGYTLTNNIMLMESALHLIKDNPLALPTVIETARSSAEDGLEQIRDAMYRLRQQKSDHPTGLDAIARLLRVFQTATGIEIRHDYANMPASISADVDSAIYHLIQEALVNSFRHGKAAEVRVQFWYDEKSVQVQVRDLGVGSVRVEEGIGLRGMRERIEHLGGNLNVGTVADGFLVSASVPLLAPSSKVALR